MSLQEEIQQVFAGLQAEFSEKKGIISAEYTVAERKSFLSKKKLAYIAKYRIDETKKEVRFTEMLKESGSGFSSGEESGFGFKKETYKTGFGGSEGTIEEQSTLFGKKYSYTFDYGKIRKAVEEKVKAAGYGFKYQITPIGL
ncbi:MAG TPA: hypothetical protein VGJ94_03375 [Syntrophorhabdaceae bacterium]|jgi:hypothetical protein